MWHRLKTEFWHILRACRRWQDDDGALLAASVAYYVGLSFFPLMLVLISGFGAFLTFSDAGQNAEELVLKLVSDHVSPALEQQTQKALNHLKGNSLSIGPLALVGILIASIAGFTQFERAFNHIWRVPQPKKAGFVAGLLRVLKQRGIAFLMLLVMGTLIIAVFFSDIIFSSVERYAANAIPQSELVAKWSRNVLTFVFNLVTFTILYLWLPRARVLWKDALRGGILASTGWEIGRHMMTALVVGNNYTSAFGVLGTFIAIQVWCYYAIAIIFLGAEYIQEFSGGKANSVTEPSREEIDVLEHG